MQKKRIKSLFDNKLCNVLLGLFNPFKHDIPEYKRYDITKLKDNCRFLEVILNRGGSCGGLIALFFDGATCDWQELPKPDDVVSLKKFYSLRESFKNKSVLLFLYQDVYKKFLSFLIKK